MGRNLGEGNGLVRTCGLILALSTLGLTAAGCSMSFPLPPLMADVETTGSITPALAPLGPGSTNADWDAARPALEDALDPAHEGKTASWRNPASGLSGHFVAEGEAFVQDDRLCRKYRAEVATEGTSRAMTGTACRVGAGPWAVREARAEAQG
jgi:surface antigen